MKLRAEWKMDDGLVLIGGEMALCGRSQDVLSLDSNVVSHFDYLYQICGIHCQFSEGYLLKTI